ncbi:hypothetical protein BCR37DRAFT_385680 [Protomyces lactucae-debilis]|uniref:Uncharacterized protein n=1 Tax=Protomyces lactucae-debilis TaxID=2754530 RepID=A0A1Y2FQD9_PROLT|nr:uncharacterized protein BCR37DRAFT_385680 [Protomyces lactucae-debilis]ORY86198.1 hypothetical protein BCR37DRAFT_385680 [Protomyces lactucae-debilis]
MNTLPKDHPSTENAKTDTCPVTNAKLSHHKDVVHSHPKVADGATEKDCPVLSKAAEDKVCPVVGTASKALPPNHPSTADAKEGEVCPVTQATASHHKDVMHDHPAVAKDASAKQCPVAGKKGASELTRERDDNEEEVEGENGKKAKKQKTQKDGAASCPVTGSEMKTLPADHPALEDGKTCPKTGATKEHHADVVHEHSKVSKDASEKDCPVASKKDQSKTEQKENGQCPVTGSSVHTLPPDHPSTEDAKEGAECPVTKATVSHHKEVVHEHPKVSKDASKEDCPVASK